MQLLQRRYGSRRWPAPACVHLHACQASKPRQRSFIPRITASGGQRHLQVRPLYAMDFVYSSSVEICVCSSSHGFAIARLQAVGQFRVSVEGVSAGRAETEFPCGCVRVPTCASVLRGPSRQAQASWCLAQELTEQSCLPCGRCRPRSATPTRAHRRRVLCNFVYTQQLKTAGIVQLHAARSRACRQPAVERGRGGCGEEDGPRSRAACP